MSGVREEIEHLEGEIMLAAFHGYRLPGHEARLLELLELYEKQKDEDQP